MEEFRSHESGQSPVSASLHQELNYLRVELVEKFAGRQWSSLAGTLEAVARVGQHQGERELCLRAQSLRELMGNRAGGRHTPGERVTELFDELMFHLSHIQWKNEISH